MLYKDKEGLKLSSHKVRYIQHGEEKEQYICSEGQQWWLDFADKWDHTEIIEFIEVSYTPEQLERFEEVKDMKLSEDILNTYVVEGIAGEGLEMLALKKENAQLKAENIMQGQIIADLDFRLMMGGM